MPESDTDDEKVVEVYRDLKRSLRVPVIPSLFQAYAQWPRFLDAVWRRLRPSLLSVSFLERARNIADTTARGVADWPVSDHASTLALRHTPPDVARMRDLAGLFHHLNPKLLIIASAIQGALADGAIGGLASTGPRLQGESYDIGHDHRMVAVALVNEREAPLRVRTIFEDMKTVTGIAFIDSEHRAIATSPDWLEIWWRDCKAMYGEPRRAELSGHLIVQGRTAATELPYRLALSAGLLASLGVHDEAREQIAQTTSVFCDMLPGLTVDMAIARKGLGHPDPSK